MDRNNTHQELHSIKKSSSYVAWINVGYDLFAREGPEGIQIERLARIINLNKSGFYHYFGTRDIYFEHLMVHHIHNVDVLVANIQTMHSFVPEYIQFLADFSTPVLVHMQLARAGHVPLFAHTYKEANYKIDLAILPLWSDFIETPEDSPLALRYFEFFRDLFYARLNAFNPTYGFIYALCNEAKSICLGFKKSNTEVMMKVG
jgi:AcrR family transcriptional regulator